ncbi:MAG: enoyl-CoA hydratase/isomerase family protein [Dehalococcoidia bacterium]|nr:enoyl-CoA hydratase/isomerase family protein [Dehalococcoidia bacterium]
MEFNNLTVEIEKPIAIVTVNRPKVLNALNLETVDELAAAFAMLDANEDVRAIIMTGSGEKAFVAGADITEFRGKTAPEMFPFAKKGHDAARIMESMGTPIIAAVNGFALGGGCEMAMACDMRFASETAQFGQPEILLGLIPGMGGTQRLARLVGLGIARELIYSGDRITAQRAYEIGLVNKVFPADQLMEETKKFALKLAAKPSHALKMAKLAMNYGYDLSLDNALMVETQCFAQCWSHPDLEEGVGAFIEKRKANFHPE